MVELNKAPVNIAVKQGVAANINTTVTKNLATEGEPHWTTDTNQLWVFDGSNNTRVHGLDTAVVNDGDVVTNDGEIVFSF